MPSIVWNGQLTFGLVSIPVRLFRAARRERVRLHYVHQSTVPAAEPDVIPEDIDDAPQDAPVGRPHVAEAVPTSPEPEPAAPISRVRQSFVTSDEERAVSRSELLTGYEVEPERYVVLDQRELKGLQRRTSPTMEIIRSVKLSEIDPVFFETSYYVVPDRGGERPYGILFKALRETAHVALARVGMYGREHVIIVRPGDHGILAHTMFYVDEIRFDNEFRADVQSVGAKEFELAKAFLEALEAPFAPEEFKDAYREELQSLIAKKTGQAQGAAGPEPPVKVAPPVDILEALRKSIAMARKPAGVETAPARKSAARVTEKGVRQSRKAR